MNSILDLISNHPYAVGSTVAFLVTLLKLTKWGRAQGEALDMLVNIIEEHNFKPIKREMAEASQRGTQGAADAIDNAVRKADRRKTPRPFLERATMELLRGWGRKA